jgi:hypothetical protein
MESTYSSHRSYILNGVLSKEEAINYLKDSFERNWKADPAKTNGWAKKLIDEIIDGNEDSYNAVNKEIMIEIFSNRKVCPTCGQTVYCEEIVKY